MSTRVREPDEDDWGKLKRLLKYVNGTMYLPLTLEASDLNFIRWWVDASFAVHPDFWSHSGAVMMLGKGMIMGGSRKQKINTRSSTEAEIIGVDDYAGPILWTNYFMKAQGFKPEKTVIYQDNQSAILLEKNGKESSGKRTRHMNFKYFLSKTGLKKVR